jgi:cytochrome bd-type quinol oxidase subunit 2
MGAERYAGFFMLVTALIVAVPVLFQLRAREADFRHAWAPVLFFLGLAATGCAFAFVPSDKQTSIAVAGVAAMLISLLFGQTKKASQ